MQKVIVLPKDPTNMEELTLEEVEVFRVRDPEMTKLLSVEDEMLIFLFLFTEQSSSQNNEDIF